MLIAADMDDTIAVTPLEPGSSGLRYPMTETIKALQTLKNAGWKVAIWSHREDGKRMTNFCSQHGVSLDAVNAQPCRDRPDYPGNPHGVVPYKLHADIYLDDKAVNPLGKTAGQIIEEIGALRKARIAARLAAGAHRGDTP
jgi:hypothetical protein